ncbi:neuromedin-U receptor 2-like [Gigantopelta aegis]|uniref:neuromedin-U receptor 2-like n=1 Tax=Gigantopelta aegis TaxID=1735272 RepID=UPI001B888BF8|nr:neuromedin-U receptor 2-like [Gigantopelta aegis]
MESTTPCTFYTQPDVATRRQNSSSLYSSTQTLGESHDNITDYLEYQVAPRVTLVYSPILASLGIVGNMLSLCVLLFSSFRKSPSSWYLATIAVLDTMILVYSILDLLYRNLPYCAVYNDVTCPMIQFLFYFCVHSNVLVLVAMTIERFIVVRFPLRAVTLITRKTTLAVITGIGLFSF